jgi:RNA polymerase sigma-70 factor, ECF subfamily
MDGPGETAAAELRLDAADAARARPLDLESSFHAYYKRLARIIARVIRDTARAEELAVDVLLKWSRHPRAQGDQAEGWLYRTAVRSALNELRREARRARHERLFGTASARTGRVDTPEDARASEETAEHVRTVLRAIRRRHAELLVLRSHGLSYEELATSLRLNPASVGTLLTRAQQAFRKEYTKRYGAD